MHIAEPVFTSNRLAVGALPRCQHLQSTLETGKEFTVGNQQMTCNQVMRQELK
jgi:hypothetical protein